MTCTCAATGGKMCPAHGEPWPVAKVLEERAKYERHIGALAAENQRLAERVRVLEIERLQKDATRYQWLKATPLTLTPKYMKDFSTVDEAIDAAIAGKLPNHA